ncbi:MULTISPECIES: DUF6776 family protein [unclassified Acinetobacter]|uniref:DUF6776 family protein n=1 Tax=unclassified Acinetobacter TaxID=196816 RepID=UPI0035B9572E
MSNATEQTANSNNSPVNTPENQPTNKPNPLKKFYPIIIGGVALAIGSLTLGYTVGMNRGLTVVGYDGDVKDLAEIVEKQKTSLDTANTALNTAVQERDIAITNARELNIGLERANQDKALADMLSSTYREKLRERGGLSLSIQNLSIKPLPNDAYEYVLDLVQVSPNKAKAQGRIEIRLINNENTLSIPLEKSGYNFDNYERLTGRWTMPDNFSPQFVEVRLSGGGGVIQRFAWQRGKETATSNSESLAEIPKAQASAN